MTVTAVPTKVSNELLDNIIEVIGAEALVDYLTQAMTPQQLSETVQGILEAEGLEVQ